MRQGSPTHYGQNVGPLRGGPVLVEEASDFDLPSIFKPGHQAPAEKQNLFGRLSDALKSQHAEVEILRSPTVIPFEPAHGRMIEPPRPDPVPEPPRASHFNQADKVATENASVKREMPTFFDTRMKALGQSAQPKPVPQPPPQAAPMPPQAPPLSIREPHLSMPRPPALPEGAMGLAASGAVEDAAAQMLRPILRQWLTENMPKIVEKALRSEAGDDMTPGPVKSGE